MDIICTREERLLLDRIATAAQDLKIQIGRAHV